MNNDDFGSRKDTSQRYVIHEEKGLFRVIVDPKGNAISGTRYIFEVPDGQDALKNIRFREMSAYPRVLSSAEDHCVMMKSCIVSLTEELEKILILSLGETTELRDQLKKMSAEIAKLRGDCLEFAVKNRL